MKKLLNLKNIAIAALVVIVLLEYFNPGGKMPGRTIRIAGKSYEVIKHEIDTVDIVKTKVRRIIEEGHTRKGLKQRQDILKNGQRFYKTHMNTNFMADYMFWVINNIAVNR